MKPKENKTDTSRAKLVTIVGEIKKQLFELEKRIEIAKAELAITIETVIENGEGDPRAFRNTKNNIELFEAVHTELNIRLKAAKVAVWNHDIDLATKDYYTAVDSGNKVRAEIIQLQKDKISIIRKAYNHRKPEDAERISHIDILLAEANSQARQLHTERNQKKIAMEKLKTEFNKVAPEMGAVALPLLSMTSRLSGR